MREVFQLSSPGPGNKAENAGKHDGDLRGPVVRHARAEPRQLHLDQWLSTPFLQKPELAASQVTRL